MFGGVLKDCADGLDHPVVEASLEGCPTAHRMVAKRVREARAFAGTDPGGAGGVVGNIVDGQV